MEYVAGRNNLACTIFVPYDCDNNCPFCTSKWMYRECGGNYNEFRSSSSCGGGCGGPVTSGCGGGC